MSAKMKITAGLGTLEQYDAYVEAGADELFCGVVPFEWLEKYGVMLPLNRREVLLYPTQIASMEDMRLLSRMAERDRVPVAVTMNSFCYNPEALSDAARLMEELTQMGFTRFIVSDPALLLKLPAGCTAHISGEWGEMSRASMEWFRNKPVSRVIFHRKVTIPEMAACASVLPDLEYEAFLMNERCFYTGAYCNSLHCDELPHICRIPWVMGGAEEPVAAEEAARGGSDGCGLCAIEALWKAGITHLKIVGRGDTTEHMVKTIKTVKDALINPSAVDKIHCGGACYYREETV